MAAQPANTEIKVFRTLRSYRNATRHDSVAALIKRLREAVAVIPGEEVQVSVLTRDTSTKDMSPYMGEARHNAGRGFPIVIGLNAVVPFSEAQANLTDVDFAFQIGQDFFLTNTSAGLTGDLYGEAKSL